MDTFFDIKINQLDGQSLDLAKFNDKKILIVNVASECGYTPQYTQMQELYELYQDKLEIIAVPCNDFGAQEPGSATEIQQFCSKNYGVTFTVTEKISLYNPIHPLYEWLCQKSRNGVSDAVVEWNFHKFLLDENGKWLASHKSAVSPLDEMITKHLE